MQRKTPAAILEDPKTLIISQYSMVTSILSRGDAVHTIVAGMLEVHYPCGQCPAPLAFRDYGSPTSQEVVQSSGATEPDTAPIE